MRPSRARPSRSLLLAGLLAACSSTQPERGPLVQTRAAGLVADLRARGLLDAGAGSVTLEVGLPVRARDGLRVSLKGVEGAYLEVTPAEGRAVTGRAVGGATVFEDADQDTDVVYTVGPSRAEEIRMLRTPRASSVARYHVRVGAGLASLRLVAGRVQALDRAGQVRLESAPVFAVDASGTHRDGMVRLASRGDGTWTLETEIDTHDLVYPVAVDPAWSPGGSLATPRSDHVAVRLASGKVLLAGGNNGLTVLSDAELYDPATNTWSSAGTMSTVRRAASGALLPSGKVLVAGGYTTVSYPYTNLTSADLYDPATNTWSLAGSMTSGRGDCATVTLPSGKILFAAGYYNQSAEIYDPATDTFTAIASLGSPRWAPTGTVLASGKVLVTGGVDGSGYTQSIAELYDPAGGGWAPAGPMTKQRARHSAVLLGSGKVLVAGGNPGSTYLTDAELYDPAIDKWTAVAPMALGRSGLALVLLPSGQVLAAGGSFSSPAAEVFDPIAGSWLTVTGDTVSRLQPTGTVLSSGKVLVAGGSSSTATMLFAQLALGVACTQPGECASGRCVDGVCCNSACAGVCSACDLGGSLGTCSTVTGAPHGARSCSPYGVCAGGACASSCATFADCAAGFYCASGKCVPKRSNGLACGAASDCSSGVCVDGVCCNAGCTGQCEACDVAGSFGTCSPVNGPPRGGRAGCTGVAAGTTCGIRCDGVDRTKCNYPTSTSPCGADECSAGVARRLSSCGGAGLCTETASSCGAYACGATTCKVSCSLTTDCAVGHYCKAGACTPIEGLGTACTTGSTCASGSCVEGVCCATASCDAGSSCATPGKKGLCARTLGSTCAIGAECGSGFCSDGVCCDTACTGQCEACDVVGGKGTCQGVAGAPHSGRPACDDGGKEPCKALTCDGAADRSKCTAYAAGSSTVCSASSCAGSTLTLSSTCDGKGTCEAQKTSSCVPFACDETGCLKSCTSEAQCAEGFECTGGTCVGRAATCSADKLSSINKVGSAEPCAPYRCGPTGACLKECASSEDCQAGSACDPATKNCTPAAGNDASGGCRLGAPSAPASGTFSLFLIVAALARRGRRSRARRWAWVAVVAGAMLAACSSDRAPPPLTRTVSQPLYAWGAAAPMSVGRIDHSATRLASGKVLVVGGGVSTTILYSSAELYDPVANTWSAAASLPTPRTGHAALLLPSGKILVAGGYGPSPTGSNLYDPTTNTWTTSPSYVPGGTSLHLLPSGKVLLLGYTTSLYDPATDTWSAGAPPSTTRINPSAVSLASGKVLLTGGESGGSSLTTAEIYDPATDSWSSAASFTGARFYHRTLLLPSGKVLLHGGQPVGSLGETVQLYDPATDTWSAGASSARQRWTHNLVLLPNGRVLATGGTVRDVEVYDPVGDAWAAAGSTTGGVTWREATALLSSGAALITGGMISGGATGNVVDIFKLVANGGACADPGECSSGRCVSGLCCDSACTGTCSACDLAGLLGTCSPVTGTPHYARSCGAYACVSGACATGCSSDTSCLAAAWCSGSTCVPKKTDGTSCAASNECLNGHCVDGVCCDVSCGGQCEACDIAGKVGTCTPAYGLPHGARAACTGAGLGTTCGASCDGKDPAKCTFAPVTTFCSATACRDGLETHGSLCDGAGACKDVPKSCGAYGCDKTACKVSCATGADCAAGYYCKSAACVVIEDLGTPCSDGTSCKTGFCVDGVCCGSASCAAGSSCATGTKPGSCAKLAGAGCVLATECGSGFCVDGVCCDRACDGQCEACNAAGAKGKCQGVSGPPHGARPPCDAGGGNPCKAMQCDGATDATKCVGFSAGPTTECAPSSCKAGTVTQAATCDGKGSCQTPTTTSCAPYACGLSGKGCLKGCTVDAHCADGFECRAGLCISRGDKCTDDLAASVTKDGTKHPCAPYRCGSTGLCLAACATSTDCATGSSCDIATKTCVSNEGVDSGGGCAFGAPAPNGTRLAPLALAALACALRRRRRSS